MILSGLPGCTADKEAVMLTGFRAALKALKDGKGVTDANDHGAINVWIDDAGLYRCEAMRHLQTVDRLTATSFAKIKPWISKWRKKIAVRPAIALALVLLLAGTAARADEFPAAPSALIKSNATRTVSFDLRASRLARFDIPAVPARAAVQHGRIVDLEFMAHTLALAGAIAADDLTSAHFIDQFRQGRGNCVEGNRLLGRLPSHRAYVAHGAGEFGVALAFSLTFKWLARDQPIAKHFVYAGSDALAVAHAVSAYGNAAHC